VTGLSAETALSGIAAGLRNPLIAEYNKLAKNYREQRWEPVELNGGRICEIVHTIIKAKADGSSPDGPQKPKNMVAACLALEAHTDVTRSLRIQIPRMLVALYEVRNNRNVGHVGSDVDPSHMDATVVFSLVKWIMAELVRVFHNITTEQASAVAESITEREVPILWRVGDTIRVLSNLSAKDKTLAILYASAGAVAFKELIAGVEYGNPSRFRSVVLKGAHRDHLLHFDAKSDTAQISPVGSSYVERDVPLSL
jgi:hypothetical protein